MLTLVRVALVILLFASGAHADKRGFALVVGVSNYDSFENLPNAARDATLIAETFRDIGFDVEISLNPTGDTLRAALDAARMRRTYDVGVLYFAGHGVQVMGENFLIAKDGVAGADRGGGMFALSEILSDFAQVADRVVVLLDACRNNPFGVTADNVQLFLNTFPGAYASYALDVEQLQRLAARSIERIGGLSRVDVQPSNTVLA